MTSASNTPPRLPPPPISQSGEPAEYHVREEPNYAQYADFLQKSLEPAVNDWSQNDLAAMLLHELAYSPDESSAGGREDSLAHHQQMQVRAKRAIANKKEDVNPDLARGIYYVSLSRAWLEDGVWITKLTREQVAEGLTYIQQCQWAKNNPELTARLCDLARRLTK
jgi:hypothetical protein